jgi:hypothetical protein
MPQILPDYLETVFYVYDNEDAANNARPRWGTGGTGFFVAMPFEGVQNEGGLYAVTAAHVVQKKQSVCLRFSNRDGSLVLLPIKRNDWHLHPDGEDIAVAPIDDSALQVGAIPPQQFLTDEIIQRYAIGLGDETFVVGRFINHEGKQRNTPTVRFGNIAMMPSEPIPNPSTRRPRPAYLVETRSQSGYSGSPVFVYINAGTPRVMGNATGSLLSGQGPWLLGVLWGYTEATAAKYNHLQVFQTGLAAVVPVPRLAEPPVLRAPMP